MECHSGCLILAQVPNGSCVQEAVDMVLLSTCYSVIWALFSGLFCILSRNYMIEETYVGQELEIRFSHRYFSSLRIFFFFSFFAPQ